MFHIDAVAFESPAAPSAHPDPCGVKAERGVRRHADPLARNKRQQQRTGRRTLTVDDDPLTGVPRAGKLRDVLLDASATIIHDPLGGGRRYPHQPDHHYYEATHSDPTRSERPRSWHAPGAQLFTERARLEWVDF